MHRIVMITVVVASVFVGPRRANGQCDQWIAGPFVHTDGANDVVNVAITWDPDGAGPLPDQLVIGGRFATAGGTIVNCIARWDGFAWQPFAAGFDGVGAGSGMIQVNALAVLPSTFGAYAGQLVAGGYFASASGITVNNIARWDGAGWQPMQGGIAGEVTELAVGPSSAGALAGRLVAGGIFGLAGGVQVNGVASWDGSAWQDFAGGPVTGIGDFINSITFWDPDDTGPLTTQLVAGGGWVDLGWPPSGGIILHRWDGVAWQAIGPLNAGVSTRALRAMPTGIPFHGGLFAGGGGLKLWDPTVSQWLNYGQTLSAYDNSVHAFAVMPSGNGVLSGRLLTAGHLYDTGTNYHDQKYVASWDGSAWQDLAGYCNDTVNTLTTWDSDGGGAQPARLVAGGAFTRIGSAEIHSIAYYDGAAWQRFGTSPSSPTIRAFTPFGGRLVAGGSFTFSPASSTTPNNIAAWDGNAISPLGTGMNGGVRALRSFNSGAGASQKINLVAGGDFTTAGGVTVNRIAQWSEFVNLLAPVNWTALGPGFNNSVYAIERFNNQVVAAGAFTATSTGTTLNRIAMWNGSGWSQLGSGLNGACNALKVYNGSLYAGGAFNQANGSVNTGGLARWDGTNWSSVNGAFPGIINSLEVHNNELIIGGSFTGIAGSNSPNIMTYNAATGLFGNLGSGGADGTVFSLASDSGNLYAGGGFSHVGGVSATRVARWSGAAWSDVRGGTDSFAFALAGYHGELHAGGNFATVANGALNSAGWARYLGTGAPWLFSNPSSVTVACQGDASFVARTAAGYSPLISWRHNGAPLVDGPTATGSTVSGSQENVLRISTVSGADQGTYDIVLTDPDGCGSATSTAATLTVIAAAGDGDGNADGRADGQDIGGFVSMLLTGATQGRGVCAYDMNADGVVNTVDLPLFLARMLN